MSLIVLRPRFIISMCNRLDQSSVASEWRKPTLSFRLDCCTPERRSFFKGATVKPKYIFQSGQVFGYLTAISIEWKPLKRSGSHPFWKCKCRCGNETLVSAYKLASGHTKSCGCYNLEVLVARSKTHGQFVGKKMTPAYCSWSCMIQRATNPNLKGFKNYAGRGITVCARWLKFENFFADMGKRPTGTMLDRIDTNGNYEPGNCRWATRIESANNTRTNRWITFNGKTQTLAQWSREVGLKRLTLFTRLKLGWTVEKTLTTAKMKNQNSKPQPLTTLA